MSSSEVKVYECNHCGGRCVKTMVNDEIVKITYLCSMGYGEVKWKQIG